MAGLLCHLDIPGNMSPTNVRTYAEFLSYHVDVSANIIDISSNNINISSMEYGHFCHNKVRAYPLWHMPILDVDAE